jgi:hypothetical protein
MVLKNQKVNRFDIKPINNELSDRLKNSLILANYDVHRLGIIGIKAIKAISIWGDVEEELEKPVILLFDHRTHNLSDSFSTDELEFASMQRLAQQKNIQLLRIETAKNRDKVQGKESMIDDSEERFERELSHGSMLVVEHCIGSNLVAFTDDGLHHEVPSGIFTHLITGVPIEQCIAYGENKLEALKTYQAMESMLGAYIANGKNTSNYEEVIIHFSDKKIRYMMGGMLQAAALGKIILVDGFLASAVFMLACKVNPMLREYGIFTQISKNTAHEKLIQYLQIKPLLSLELQSRSGLGAIFSIQIIRDSIQLLHSLLKTEKTNYNEKYI